MDTLSHTHVLKRQCKFNLFSQGKNVINNSISEPKAVVDYAVQNNVISVGLLLMFNYHVDIYNNFIAINSQIKVILILNVYKCVIK